MNYLSVENLSKYFGDVVLFENLVFGLSKGDKVAMIARNGTGKSTLMKILVGKEEADEGSVVVRDGVRIGHLEQHPEFAGELSILEVIGSESSDLLKVIKNYEDALHQQSLDYNSQTQQNFELASAEMDKLQAWDYERRMKQILTRFNITNLDQKVNTLSGGQKKRLALAFLLLDEPDLLLLDEPTNHLDIEMIEWLEGYLESASITLLMVTHDRYFLDNVCNQVLEMSGNRLFRHMGNYAHFLEKRAERQEAEKVETDKAKKLMKQELEWMRRTPMARTTKSKSRIDSFYKIEEKASNLKTDKDINLEVNMSRVGGKILELRNLTKSFGEIKIIQDFEYTFVKGDRIGIIGKNGVGKSTFLNIITEKEKADKGTVVRGETIVYGYYTQQGIQFREDQRVIDVLKEIAEVVVTGKGNKISVSQFLQFFMFTPAMQQNFVGNLSGGERRRLYLLTVLIKNPNFLILDEPTNDLDIETLNRLEDFLMSYGGCLIIVSHDRYFIDRLANHLFVFEGEGKIKDFYGNYSDYHIKAEKKQKKEKSVASNSSEAKAGSKKPAEKTKLTYKERLEYEALEKEIEVLEKEKAELEIKLNTASDDYEALQQYATKIGELIGLIDDKTFRWMELDEWVK
jgi:ATP-binding cassette subfamily F protein uup